MIRCKNCNVTRKITLQDIDKFFDITNSIKCNTKIVYLNRFDDGDVLSDLYVKQIDQDCHIFYSVKNGYYYVYPQFIQNILLWSKHPQAFGQEGRLGNHISIGSKNGYDIDIHETLYSSKFSNKGHVLIANKKRCDYTIDSDNKTLISNNCHLDQLSQILWDDICCSIYPQTPTIGGNKKKYNLIKKNKIKKPIININKLTNLINEIIKKNKFKKNKTLIVRLPYIRASQLKILSMNILRINKEISIITNSYCKCSALII